MGDILSYPKYTNTCYIPSVTSKILKMTNSDYEVFSTRDNNENKSIIPLIMKYNVLNKYPIFSKFHGHMFQTKLDYLLSTDTSSSTI